MKNTKPLLTGAWEWLDGASWSLYASSKQPPTSLCTAVSLIAISDLGSDQIVLTRNQRGLDLIAGHIEPGELPIEALRRESLEEAGFTFEKALLYGHAATTMTKRPTADSRAHKYPYPVNYVLHYYAFGSQTAQPTGDEILGSEIMTLSQLQDSAPDTELGRLITFMAKAGLDTAKSTRS